MSSHSCFLAGYFTSEHEIRILCDMALICKCTLTYGCIPVIAAIRLAVV